MISQILDDSRVARAASWVAILVHLLPGGVVYLLLPGLVVEFPAVAGFYAAWVVVLIVILLWRQRHPWRSLVLAVGGTVLAGALRVLGEQFLGWRG